MKFDEDLVGNSKGALETLVSMRCSREGNHRTYDYIRFVPECQLAAALVSLRMNRTCLRVILRKKRSKKPRDALREVWPICPRELWARNTRYVC